MLSRLTSEINARPLGLARVVVGIAAMIRLAVTWRILSALTREDVVSAPYVDWLPQPTRGLVMAIAVVWALGAIGFTLGWRVRLSGTALLVCIVLTLVLDQQTYANHLYLMAWLVGLLTFAGAGADLNVRRTSAPVLLWPVLLLMTQLSIVYGFSALTKFNESFFSGEVLATTLGGGLISFPDSWRITPILIPLAALAVFTELFIAVFIWRAEFRPAVFILGLGLHSAITLFMAGTLELMVFSLEMLALYPLFLSRERLVVVWDDACGACRRWITRFETLDLLRTVEPVPKSDPRNHLPPREIERSLHLVHHDQVSTGFGAVTRTLEHLVPTLWFASILRLPAVAHLGERWYRWQARRRACLLGGEAAVLSSDSTGR